MSKKKSKTRIENVKPDMKNFNFKTEPVEIDGDQYNVHEISIGQRRKILSDFDKDKDSTLYSVGLIVGGCEEFENSSVDEILGMPVTLFDEIARAVASASSMNPDDDEGGETKKAD